MPLLSFLADKSLLITRFLQIFLERVLWIIFCLVRTQRVQGKRKINHFKEEIHVQASSRPTAIVLKRTLKKEKVK